MKSFQYDVGHMTKMSDMPIYVIYDKMFLKPVC